MDQTSPFLNPPPCVPPNGLANLHLKKDLQLHIILRESDDLDEGYQEGKVTNTRFGSFPHSTLIGVPWGSQVRASLVDTGTRGRQGLLEKQGRGNKRKRGIEGVATPKIEAAVRSSAPLTPATASSGFVHILPPTPESWTESLPHRTQVVYTPDYSYILHRLRVRPGSAIIEAGAGSGSFTHASARAVFNRFSDLSQPKESGTGKVWSYEFHDERVVQLQEEISCHGLQGVVQVLHRDVCEDGFGVEDASGQQLVQAHAIFLDLPAPWLALKHLTRNRTHHHEATGDRRNGSARPASSSSSSRSSVLSPSEAIRICTFSPCIEQVTRTVSTLRQLGWTDVSCVEIAARRLEVRRERVGLQEEGLRGVDPSPATVEEAVQRLQEIEARTTAYRAGLDPVDDAAPEKAVTPTSATATAGDGPVDVTSKQARLAAIRDAQTGRKTFKEGRLAHRSEPQLKTHTSYLVFAILPQEWTVEDEALAQAKWASPAETAPKTEVSRRQVKKLMKLKAAQAQGTLGAEDVADPS